MVRATRFSLLFGALCLAACGGTPTGSGSSVSTAGGSGGSDVGSVSGSNSGSTSAAASSNGSAGTNASTGASASGTTRGSGANTNGSGANTNGTGTNTSGSGTGESGPGTTGVGFAGGNGSGGGTGGSCYPLGTYVGPSGAANCCTGAVDANGYCAESSGNGGTSAGTTGDTGDGTNGSSGTTGTGACSAACYSARGYHCENGQCILNGGGGQLQFTLQWDKSLQTGQQRAREDLDLHVVEPLPDGGPGGTGREIYYGDPHPTRAVGWLDLDQNAGCSQTDNPDGLGNDTENVIYPTDGGMPPHGLYKVIVDDYTDQCDGPTPNPFYWVLTIRNGAQITAYDGGFSQANPNNADNSGNLAGASDTAGHKVFTFTY